MEQHFYYYESYQINNYLSSLSFDEQTTAELEARLSELHDLARKHTCQITELITTQDSIIFFFW
jgi:DNA repair protein RecN (Recombination protein N)